MLSQERIPISKLKQAFDLNKQDVETVISALWPNEIFPYALWEMAYKSRWKDAASHNSTFNKAKELSSFPGFDPLEYKMPLLHIYEDRLTRFFRELSTIIFVTDLMDGLNRIIELTYDKNDTALHSDIEYLSDGLSYIESDLNFGVRRPFTWSTNITAERFYEVFKSKVSFISPCTTAFISKIFIDAIVVDKIAAIRELLKCGCYLKREVKGISRALVDRIAATLDVFPLEDTPAPLPTSSIVVPRALWEGKSPEAICKAMDDEGFGKPIIAYVLSEWCEKPNKTKIGQLLGPRGENEHDSTSRSRTYKLLAEAEAFTIITE